MPMFVSDMSTIGQHHHGRIKASGDLTANVSRVRGAGLDFVFSATRISYKASCLDWVFIITNRIRGFCQANGERELSPW